MMIISKEKTKIINSQQSLDPWVDQYTSEYTKGRFKKSRMISYGYYLYIDRA